MPSDHNAPLADGVYVGFTFATFDNNPITHNFIVTVQDGKSHTYEYGPDANDKLTEQKYGDNAGTAKYGLVPVAPPPGISTAEFTERVGHNARLYDNMPLADKPFYNATASGNCEDTVSGILKQSGSSQKTIDDTFNSRSGVSFDPHFPYPLDMKAVETLQRREDSPVLGQSIEVVHSGPGAMPDVRAYGLPFQQSGVLLSANQTHVTQQIRGGESFTYKTSDLLGPNPNPDTLRALENAAANRDSVNLKINENGLVPSSVAALEASHTLGNPSERVPAITR